MNTMRWREPRERAPSPNASLLSELPLREAMSVICTDPIGPVDPGAVFGDVEQSGA